MRRRFLFVLLLLVIIAAGFGVYWTYRNFRGSSSSDFIRAWFTDRSVRPSLTVQGNVICGDAPFILPTTGFIGLLWADPAGPYSIMNRHTGLDIFGDGQPGEIPIYAAYDGYLTRLEDWKSTVIIQHDDPLQPGRTIWTYYTHMADVNGIESYVHPDFPAGTRGEFVEQGRLLGYQGDYGGPTMRVGLHLHFSIVTSDENGVFKNESILENTLDPSPYLGMNVDITNGAVHPIRCNS